MSKIFGMGNVARDISDAVKGTAEVFHVNQTEKMRLEAEQYQSALGQYASEFIAPLNWFDSFINGLNRLPRPIMAIGTIGLFSFSMIDPDGFSSRMIGLSTVPEPLWWLLGAIVSFYFGARELHHFRVNRVMMPKSKAKTIVNINPDTKSETSEIMKNSGAIAQNVKGKINTPTGNAAIDEWLQIG